MEMEFMAEFTEGMSRDRARQIIRGKRTKRNRNSSPFAVSTTSGNYNYSDSLINNFTSDNSPVMSSEMSTEEDEDMANCLIMLAQSVSPVKEEKSQSQFKLNSKSDQIRQKTEKLSSRRFTEMTPAIGIGNGNAKLGLYVYECKTCNRTFPSFQALGGHRASHKKPKVNVEEKKLGYSSSLTEYSDEDQQQQQKLAVVEDEENKSNLMIISNNVQKSPSSSSSPGFIQTINNNSTKGKVHECSICGSEFLSGQALGGHMRKHRPTPPAAINRTGISTNTDDSTTEHHMENSNSPASMLSLDLNLPAPEMADDVQSQFQFTAGSSQSHLVFSAPALVDCHY